MAITAVSEPDVVTLVKNEVKYVFSTDNYWSTAGVKSKVELNFSGSCPLNNETMTLPYTDEDGVVHAFLYVFKTSPSGLYEIKKKPIGDYVDDWIDLFVLPKLKENFYLSRDFNITAPVMGPSAATILIEAKKTGVCDISSASEICTDMTMTNKTAPTVAVAQLNFKILLELFVENVFMNGTFDKIITLEGVPNASLQCSFYLERYIRSLLAIDIPDFGLAALDECANIFKRFFVYACEYYGDPPFAGAYTRYPATNTNYNKALLGGQKAENFVLDTFYNDYFDAAGKKFLTNMPDKSIVQKTQPQYLYWYTKDNDISMRLDLFYTDGTNSTHTPLSSSSFDAYSIIIVPVGYTALNIDSLKTAGKTVQYYEVWMLENGSGASEGRKFYVEEFALSNVKYFGFKNAYGAFETIACAGAEQRKITITRNKIEKTNNSDTSTVIEGSVVDDVQGSITGVQKASGWMAKSAIDYLQEFFDSGDVYEITSSQYKKIVLLDTDMDLGGENLSNSEMFGFDFKYQYAAKNPV